MIPGPAILDHRRLDTAPITRERLNIAVVDEELPWPLNSGKRLRTWNLLSRLARRHQITYVAHRNNDPAECDRAVAHMESLGIRTRVVPRAVPPKRGIGFYGRLAANLLSPLPYSVSSHVSKEIQAAIREVERESAIDLWHCEWTPYLQNLAGNMDRPVVVTAHNVESQIWQRYAENETNPGKRWYIREQCRKFTRFERNAFSLANLSIFVSETDAELARSQYGAQRIAVIENGVDTDYFQPEFSNRDPFHLLILGSLDWRPNVDGINQFMETVFPRLVLCEPRFHLTIVGRNPDRRWAEALCRNERVSLHANVPDVRPHIARAGALVVPLRIGGGSRLKILEAAASGLPVISTRVGAEGLDFRPGNHFLETSDIGALEQAILKFLKDPERARTHAAAARQLVDTQYSWQLLAEKMERVWTSVAGKQATWK
jgi:polysaccharide biosynthesis protein PslH